MKYFQSVLVAVKSLIFMFGNRDKDKPSTVKRSGEDKIGTIILKSGTYDAF